MVQDSCLRRLDAASLGKWSSAFRSNTHYLHVYAWVGHSPHTHTHTHTSHPRRRESSITSFSKTSKLKKQHSLLKSGNMNKNFHVVLRGTRWRSWMRHCATSRKVAGSIPDGWTGNFHWHNPGPWVDSASNKNQYQEYFLEGKGSLCVGLTTLQPSCADCLVIWEHQPPGTLRACPGLEWDCSTFNVVFSPSASHFQTSQLLRSNKVQ